MSHNAYPFTARPIRLDVDPVELINGRMAQFGWGWRQCDQWPKALLDEAARMFVEEDRPYCIDAPSHIPCGACEGLEVYPEADYAVPVQITQRRP